MDEVTLRLNRVFVKVLVEVDLRFPLKRVMIVNQDEDHPILISYESYLSLFLLWSKKSGGTCMF